MSAMSNVAFDQLLTVSEVARRLNRSTDIVLRYIEQKKLLAEKKDGRWLIDEDSVTEFEKIPRRRGNPNFAKKHS